MRSPSFAASAAIGAEFTINGFPGSGPSASQYMRPMTAIKTAAATAILVLSFMFSILSISVMG